MKHIFISMAWWSNRNVIIWLLKIRGNCTEDQMHILKVTVDCPTGTSTVIGPFFKDNNRNAITVNSEGYTEVINNFFERMPIQRVLTGHTSRSSIKFFALSSATITFLALLTFPGPLSPLICPCVVISCAETSR